jgi:GMP synthase - Glutamine amidotransferase domain
LALTLGGTIRKIESFQKGNEKIEILQDNLIINNSLNVFESHRYEISKLPNVLIPIGKSDNCKYEIIQHKEKLIFGTQFHPEMSLDGNDLIENFCSL